MLGQVRPSPKTLYTIYNRLLTSNDGGKITEISGESKEHPFTKACAVVEAQGTWDFLWFVRIWLQRIDQRATETQRVDPTHVVPDSKRVEEFIEAVIDEFHSPTEDEKVLLPRLRKMSLAAKQAFYGQGCAVLKTSEEVRREAQKLLDEGIEIPPWPNA